MSDMARVIELQKIRANSFDESISPAQKKYCLDMAKWLEEQNFSTAEESMEKIKDTPFYLGGAEAKTLDDINLRIKAMEEVGYEDVAEIHRMRKAKLQEKGYSIYTTSGEWNEDFAKAQAEANKYARRKEVFGKIYSGYFGIIANPQSDHRKEAEKQIVEGLRELEAMGLNFYELASHPAYIKLTMLTALGMQKFVSFIHTYQTTGTFATKDYSHLKAEQEAIASWTKEHEKEMVEIGKTENWRSANSIAVPSGHISGYDFIQTKEEAL